MQINPTHLLLIFRCCFILALSTITYLSLLDTSELPAVTLKIWDKLQHASAFLLLSFLLHRSFVNKRLFSMAHIAQACSLLCYGVIIECLQSYSPYRQASMGDVVADGVGIICYSLFYLKYNSGQNSPHRG
jgi:VanZ family protein